MYACAYIMMGISQTVEVISPRDRDRRLEQLLHKYHSSRRNRVIVFVLYKKVVSCCLQSVVVLLRLGVAI